MAADLSVLWRLVIGPYTWPEVLRQLARRSCEKPHFVAVLGYLGRYFEVPGLVLGGMRC